jgi:hypothetical protein
MANMKIGRLAKQGAEARHRAKEQRQQDAALTLPQVVSLETAKRCLALIPALAISGVVPGSQASAAVRACEVYIRAEEAEMNVRRLKTLEAEVTRLEGELKKARNSRALRVG